ncbi:cryptochrome/photolyase family protein [Methylobrevis pamukkalensis]|uniref:Deoxyribodipyrimidine photo-lyase n=1 Tax=Methylobrevis pamukkalensis TaxID=1439726 RepID=A0A1E3H0A8_9HYPH|nr:deoxyribodipyrimidine photo-lyase [Methylobrevis pamukkalensis]ODN69011.1 Deoxyribodipyrimidine photo-lyase [Methylobrevis pamukkalensis]
MSDHPASGADVRIVWFRDDLRLSDNPALSEACRDDGPVVALYILDDVSPGIRPLGGARRWWLHHSLQALAIDLQAIGIPLLLRRGPAGKVLPEVVEAVGARQVHWNRRYTAAGIAIDTALRTDLKAQGVEVESHNGSLLIEPFAVTKGDGGWFKVFTPFWKAARERIGTPRSPLPVPKPRQAPALDVTGDRLVDWGLLPTKPDWSGGLAKTWTPGEAGARERLETFLDDGLARYKAQRDEPAAGAVSMMSPYLAFGEISPVTLWHAAAAAGGGRSDASVEKFLAELGWREFSYHLLYHFPDLGQQNFQPRFDGFSWKGDPAALAAWQKGQTGYPIVDAGMRQLWRTGWMHNRVRMVVASFLVKHLLIDWRAGEAWFWDTLVDADPANNAASWQWVAGSGADAAPYFRIFNPILQGEKFDTAGRYVRDHVPELAGLPDKWLNKPWQAPSDVRRRADVRLGKTYPEPVVDHDAARQRALAAFQEIKDQA